MHERPRLPSDRAEPASSFPPAAGVAPRATPAREGGLGLNDPRALAILSTEHTSLLSNRSNLWNESFSRAALFLSVFSAGVIALSLIGTERPDFQVFALILLPVTLFIGLTTFVRIDDSNREELRWVVAMNRLRHAYVSMVPELGDRFVSGVTDDLDGLLLSYGLPSGTNYSIFHFFVTMPGMVAVVNGVVAGVIAVTALAGFGLSTVVLGSAGAVIGVATMLAQGLRSKRRLERDGAAYTPRFTSPPGGATEHR